ncbi:8-amino-7-oxononanoate synthase, partial [bacterium]|nr:8-amino-7-oxononanoate synthase [bacterium]
MNRDSTGFLRQEYEELVKNDFDWKLHILEGASAPHCNVDGKEVIMFCSNNYLNLSNHPRLIKGAIEATKKYGAGSGSVRAIAGTMDIHMEV